MPLFSTGRSGGRREVTATGKVGNSFCRSYQWR
jgi:hypothetical protein